MYLNRIMELLRRADERTLERVYFLLRGWITAKNDTDGRASIAMTDGRGTSKPVHDVEKRREDSSLRSE